jgi:hypothetical protein
MHAVHRRRHQEGFDVKLDIANAQWWALYDRAGLRKTFRWRVVEHKPLSHHH